MLKRWWLPLLVTTLLLGVTSALLAFSFRASEAYTRYRSQALAREIALNLRGLVEGHIRALQTLGEIRIRELARDERAYILSAEALLHHYEGFYAVNFLDEKAIIRRVHPYERNKAALGRDLMKREDVRDFLLLSRERRTPVMSRKVMTFQGIEAFTIYVPLVENGEFLGWLNGVIDLQGWFRRLLEAHPEPLAVRLTWLGDPESEFRFGPEPNASAVDLEFPLWNQGLKLRIGLQDAARERQRHLEFALAAFVVVLAFGLGGMVFFLETSRQRFRDISRRLRLKNVLLSSLAHDMGTPLTVLGLGLDRLREQPDSSRLWERVRRSGETLRQMLESVRLLHAAESGRLELKTGPVDLAAAVRAAVEQVSDLATAKRIRIETQLPEHLPRVLAERATLSQNVIPNVLTNAIKFSPPGEPVVIGAATIENGVRLTVRDRGVGIPPDRLRRLNDEDGHLDPGEGTEGERGSALGLIQIRTFMDLYGGQFEIRSCTDEGADRGTTVWLTFPRA